MIKENKKKGILVLLGLLLLTAWFYWFNIRPAIISNRCIDLADYWMIENSYDDEPNYKEFYRGYFECMKGNPGYMLLENK